MRFPGRTTAALVALGIALCLPAPSVSSEGLRLSLDAGSLGVSAASGAANLLVSEALPLGGPWTLVVEEQAYVTLPSDTVFTQAAVAALLRFQPWDGAGFYLGAGPGLGVSYSSALAAAGGAAAAQGVGVKGYLIAELGWIIDFGSFPIYLEPFLRGFGAAGWDGRSGSAVSALDAWSIFGSAGAGLRVGWRL